LVASILVMPRLPSLFFTLSFFPALSTLSLSRARAHTGKFAGLADAFKKIDADGSGTVSKDEFYKGMVELETDLSELQILKVLQTQGRGSREFAGNGRSQPRRPRERRAA
jgi:hypothetical protein